MDNPLINYFYTSFEADDHQKLAVILNRYLEDNPSYEIESLNYAVLKWTSYDEAHYEYSALVKIRIKV